MPVAGTMSATGAADLLARLPMENLAQGNAIITLLLVVTMPLADVMNNAATAAVYAPSR
jgi:di/tricarboxylate transporter